MIRKHSHVYCSAQSWVELSREDKAKALKMGGETFSVCGFLYCCIASYLCIEPRKEHKEFICKCSFIYSYIHEQHTFSSIDQFNLIFFPLFSQFSSCGNVWPQSKRREKREWRAKAISSNGTSRKFVFLCFYYQHSVVRLIIKKNWTPLLLHFLGFLTLSIKRK